MSRDTPALDSRTLEQIFADLMHQREAYLPGWVPSDGDPGFAFLHIFSRYMEIIAKRLNQAPDKNKLAFFDALGFSPVAPKPARAPMHFKALDLVGDARLPAKTQIGAQVKGLDAPLIYETEKALVLAAARLKEVKTLNPVRDEYHDLTQQVLANEACTLFNQASPVPHELYLAHDTLFNFSGPTTLEVEIELAVPASDTMTLVWEFWNGEYWQSFLSFDKNSWDQSHDGTLGLTQSGLVRLRSDCGQSQITGVSNIESYWIRARSVSALAPKSSKIYAEIERIHVRSSIRKPHMMFEVKANEDEADLDGNLFRAHFVNHSGDKLNLSRVRLVNLSSPSSTSSFISSVEDGLFQPDTPLIRGARYRMDLLDLAGKINSYEFIASKTPLSLTFTLDFGFQPDIAFSDAQRIDLSKPFAPLGQYPQPGNTFYFSSEEFKKSGAHMQIMLIIAPSSPANDSSTELSPGNIKVAWEYWNGVRWATLPLDLPPGPERNGAAIFKRDNAFSFVVPGDMHVRDINGEQGFWIRALLREGLYGFLTTIDLSPPIQVDPPEHVEAIVVNGADETLGLRSGESGQGSTVAIDKVLSFHQIVPPIITFFGLNYNYRSERTNPQHTLTKNGFTYTNRSNEVAWPGNAFVAFSPVPETLPGLYLGFDQPLPNDNISLFFDVEESAEAPLGIEWEVWDGEDWQTVSVEDETRGLRQPGVVSFISPSVTKRPQANVISATARVIIVDDIANAAMFKPGDAIDLAGRESNELAVVAQVNDNHIHLVQALKHAYAGGTLRVAALPLFGQPRDWLRLHFSQTPKNMELKGVHLNSTWASQSKTIENEILGSSDGQANQVFFLADTPVLKDEHLEICELEGRRAQIEFPILQEQLKTHGVSKERIRIEHDQRDGSVKKVWVRWENRATLFFSNANDRHFTLEPISGRINFGNGANGLIPPLGSNNIRMLRYRSGGGTKGNISAGTINQLLSSAAPIEFATNLYAAQGGVDSESMETLKTRGTNTLRHQARAVSSRDWEDLAKEASAEVAVVRVLATTGPKGQFKLGSLALIILPHSQVPQPQPSLALKNRVKHYLALRAPASFSTEQISVLSPRYQTIDVFVQVVALNQSEAGLVSTRVQSALQAFLHPLRGGLQDRGWQFGRDLHASDIAVYLDAIEGIDHIAELELRVNQIPVGDKVDIAEDQIVAAGQIDVLMVNLTGGIQ